MYGCPGGAGGGGGGGAARAHVLLSQAQRGACAAHCPCVAIAEQNGPNVAEPIVCGALPQESAPGTDVVLHGAKPQAVPLSSEICRMFWVKTLNPLQTPPSGSFGPPEGTLITRKRLVAVPATANADTI